MTATLFRDRAWRVGFGHRAALLCQATLDLASIQPIMLSSVGEPVVGGCDQDFVQREVRWLLGNKEDQIAEVF